MGRRVVFLTATTVVVAAWLKVGDSMAAWLSLAPPPPAVFTSLSVRTSAIS